MAKIRICHIKSHEYRRKIVTLRCETPRRREKFDSYETQEIVAYQL